MLRIYMRKRYCGGWETNTIRQLALTRLLSDRLNRFRLDREPAVQLSDPELIFIFFGKIKYVEVR